MRTPILAALCGGLLLLGACGSSSDEAASDTAVIPGGAADTASISTSEGTDTDAAGSETTPDESIVVDTDFSGEDSEDFCALATALDEDNPIEGLFESQDPDQMEADFAQYETLIDQVVETAPDEISPDFEAIQTAIVAFGDIYDKYNWDAAEVDKAMQDGTEDPDLFNSADLLSSSARVDAYLAQVCGLSGS